MNWNDRTESKKGTLGEKIVDSHLIKKGFIPYRPVWDDVSHPFDRLVASLDKKAIFVCDAKSKAMRKYFPDTGVDMRHYRIYAFMKHQHNLDTYLAFVDEQCARIYGQFLSVLDIRRAISHNGKTIWYPKTENNEYAEIRYFPVCKMEEIGTLSDDQRSSLIGLSTRNPKYDVAEPDMFDRR